MHIDERLTQIFLSVGIPANVKGYQFLKSAIKLAVSKPDILNYITKGLYPVIAEQFNSTPSKVERGIRHAIEVAWQRGKMKNLDALFNARDVCDFKPSSSEFIALIADRIHIEQLK